MYESLLEQSWVQNQGAACTSACVLAALGALGAAGLPDLATASKYLAGAALGAPALFDYVTLPWRRAPLDVRIESLARGHSLQVNALSQAWLPGLPLRPAPGEVLIVHLAYGQEAPARYGTWGWNPLRPATYSTGGHSVVLAAVEGRAWTVLDPNRPRLQEWPRPGLATAVTMITKA